MRVTLDGSVHSEDGFRHRLLRRVIEETLLNLEGRAANSDAPSAMRAHLAYLNFVRDSKVEHGFYRLFQEAPAMRGLSFDSRRVQRRAELEEIILCTNDGYLTGRAESLFEEVRVRCLTGRARRDADYRERVLAPVRLLIGSVIDAVVEQVQRGVISSGRFRDFCREPSTDLAFSRLFEGGDTEEVLRDLFSRTRNAAGLCLSFREVDGRLTQVARAFLEEVRFRLLMSRVPKIVQLYQMGRSYPSASLLRRAA